MDSAHLLTFVIGFGAGILVMLMNRRNLFQVKGQIMGITVTSSQPIQPMSGIYTIDGYVTISVAGKTISKIWSKVYDSAPTPLPDDPPTDATDQGDPTTVDPNNPLHLNFRITENELAGTTKPDDIVLWVEWVACNNTSATGN